VANADVLLWLHTTLDHQLWMIQRSESMNYDSLWHQVKLWGTFSSDRNQNHVN